MARPVGANAEKTRAKLLSVAAVLFADHGLDGVTTRELAKKTGTTLGTVHHYFGDKESLYKEAVASVYAEIGQLREVLQAELLKGGLTDKPLERVVRLGFRFSCEHATAMRLTLRQVVETGEIPAQGRSTLQGPFLEQASMIFASLTGRSPDEVRLTLQTLVVLSARFAISNDDELATLVPSRPDRESRLLAIEDHLVRLADAMFGPISLTLGKVEGK